MSRSSIARVGLYDFNVGLSHDVEGHSVYAIARMAAQHSPFVFLRDENRREFRFKCGALYVKRGTTVDARGKRVSTVETCGTLTFQLTTLKISCRPFTVVNAINW